MCKTPEILPGMPGHSAKPHKTHMKRTEKPAGKEMGEKSLDMRNHWAAQLLPTEPTTSRPLPHIVWSLLMSQKNYEVVF